MRELIDRAGTAWGHRGVAESVHLATVPIRVVLADTKPLARASMRRALAASDLEVVAEAGTLAETSVAALAVRPHVILLDAELLDQASSLGGGSTFVATLAEALPDTSLVIVSDVVDEDNVVEMFRAGAAGLLRRTVSKEALLRAVRGAASGDLVLSRHDARQLIRRLTGRAAATTNGRSNKRLSAREREVIRFLSEGLKAREIAQALGISTRTVEGHVAKIREKLDARNRADAVRRYLEVR